MLLVVFSMLSTIQLMWGLHISNNASDIHLDFNLNEESKTAVVVERHVSHIEDIALPTQSKEHIQTDITLCIPLEMSKTDNQLFVNKFLPSLQQQSALPREIIIAGSGMNESQAREIQDLVSSFSNAPVYVTPKRESAKAGHNRNRCAKASTGRVISFFDADDAMHPRRLELLWTLFKKRAPMAVIHGWKMSAKDEMKGELGKSFTVYNGVDIFQPQTKLTEEKQMDMSAAANHTYKLHKGWITVQADVFAHVQQSETLQRGQDHQFILDVLRFYGPNPNTLMYIAEPLGWYSHGYFGPPFR